MNKKFVQYFAIVLLLASLFTGIFGAKTSYAVSLEATAVQFADTGDPWDADDNAAESCTTKSSGFAWFQCGMNKMLSSASLYIFEIAKEYLELDPDIFDTAAMRSGWATVRDLANLAALIMLIVTILSQISGIGISNYGVKKALPRILMVIVLINLSYIICQVAVDLVNIAGEAIKNTFEPLTVAARNKITYESGSVFASIMGTGTSSILTVILTYFGTKTFLSSGESITLLALFAGISIVIGILMLVITIAIRSALVVILTVTAPGAIVLAVFPGTKSAFDKWFNVFKGVLICYPMAALMVYGGNFASAIAMAALGLNGIDIGSIHIPVNVFTLIVSAAASIGPIIALPGMVIRSTGAIGAAMQRFANSLNGFAQSKIGGSAFAERHRRSATDRRNRIIGGVDKNGNERTGALARFSRSRSADERLAARQALAQSRAKTRGDEEAMGEDGLGSSAEGNNSAIEERIKALQDENLSEGDINSELDRIMSQSSGDADEMANELEAAVEYFNSLNPKCGVESDVLAKLDGMSGPDASRAREAFARRRLAREGDTIKSKTPIEHAYYRSIAAGNGVAGQFSASGNGAPDAQWVREAIMSESFTADALSKYAGPALGHLGDYLDNDSLSTPEDVAAKQKLRQTYDLMTRTSTFANEGTPSDFAGIARAIERGKGK